MWDLAPQKITSVIDDPSIALPRFQRKATWTQGQMFDLALSFHARFPLGTMVVKVDGDSGKYLLDGRQRREALQRMRDPEYIYDWAKSTLSLTNRDQDHVIRSRFYDYVSDYFGTEPFERTDQSDDSARDIGSEDDDEASDFQHAAGEPPGEYLVSQEASDAGTPGGLQVVRDLDDLLEIILLSHPKRKRTQFVRRFDVIGDLFAGHPICIREDGGKQVVVSEKLWRWVLDWWREQRVPATQFNPSLDEFVSRLMESGTLKPDYDPTAVTQRVKGIWPEAVRTVEAIVRMEQRLIDTKIGLLEITSGSHAAERKIFELINSAGTPLTAAEILSARHSWNTPLPSSNRAIETSATALYQAMGIPLHKPMVYWDQAATLLDRVDASIAFGDLCGPSGLTPPAKGASGRFERRITLGFKLMAGWYASAIDKDTIADLDKTAAKLGRSIPWGSTELEGVLIRALQKATDQEFFRLLRNWDFTLVGRTSDAAALNFVLTIGQDWIRKGSPSPGGTFDQFQRNARILLDRMVFEYVSGLWGGSGDSRIRQNLKSVSTQSAVLTPVPEAEWSQLMEGVFQGRLRGADYTGRLSDRVALLLVYRNVLRRLPLEKPSPGGRPGYEVDHIIPQDAFEPYPEFGAYRHHIGNLAPIPAELNQRKRSKPLDQIEDAIDRTDLERYEDIPIADFGSYSSASDVRRLIQKRISVIRDDIRAGRDRAILT